MKKWLLFLVVFIALLATVPPVSSRGHGHFWTGAGIGILTSPFICKPPAWEYYYWPRYYYPPSPYYYDYGWGYRYYYPRSRIWVPGYWEWRWNPYCGNWERVWIPGYWRYNP